MREDAREVLLEYDYSLTQRLRYEAKPGLIRTLSILFAHSGDSWFWILGLGVVWFIAEDYWKLRAALLLAGIFITAVVVFLIKFTVRRSRPEGDWGSIYRKTDPHSFPSGHAARAAMLAAVAIGIGP